LQDIGLCYLEAMDANTIEEETLPLCAKSELEEIWLDKAEKRAAEIDGGCVALVSSELVSRKAQGLLR
jgi:hypothetical protein